LYASLAFWPAAAVDASTLATAGATEIVQASRSELGWALVEHGDETHITDRQGHSQTLPLRDGESLFLLSDVAGQWIAGGTEIDAKGADLLLVSGGRDTFQRLSVPAEAASVEGRRQRLRAVPLVSDERLVGLAWLEGAGHRSLAVRVSAWDGESWSPPSTVSPPGPGSQTGLVGAVLADGSWLLVWSAFDGEDDEVMWSLRRENGWTQPARVDGGNSVQDVRPNIIATPDGALLAWSRFDGTTYRTELARFRRGNRDSNWESIDLPRPLPAVEPSWVANDRWVALLLKTADPSGWAVRELQHDGTPVRFWRADEGVRSQPLIDPSAARPRAWEWFDGALRRAVELVEERDP